MSARKRWHTCEACDCGTVTFEWADRQPNVEPDNLEQVVDVILSCILDSTGDRQPVPYGLPDHWRAVVLPIGEKYIGLEYSRPDYSGQRKALRAELRAALEAAGPYNPSPQEPETVRLYAGRYYKDAHGRTLCCYWTHDEATPDATAMCVMVSNEDDMGGQSYRYMRSGQRYVSNLWSPRYPAPARIVDEVKNPFEAP